MGFGENYDPVFEERSRALDGARTGDEEAIRCLYRWLNPPLLRYLRYHLPALADDIASEVWLGVAQKLPRFEGGPRELQAFVFTVARRRLVDEHRRRGRQLPAVPLEEAEEPPTGDLTEETGIEQVATQRAVEMLVADLPAEQAEVVLLRVLGDLSVAQVARILRKSAGAVRVAQHRGLQRVSERLNKSGVTQ